MRKRASEINERKREQEASDKVVAIQNKIKGTFKTALVQPHRRLLRETMLTLERCVKRVVVKSGSGVKAQLKEAMVERDYLFLIFNDIILQCKVVAPASNGGSSSSLVTATSTISSTPPATSLTSPTAQTIPTDAAYELVRTLRLSSRHRPASIVHQTWAGSLAPSLPIAKPRMLLRVVDEDVVVYVRGGVEELDMVCRMVNEGRG